MRPVVIEAEVDISRPPGQVFDYCCDPGHEPEWNPMMKASKKITDRPIGVGARYATEFVKGPPMVMACAGYQRPSAWSPAGSSSALKAGGGVNGHGGHEAALSITLAVPTAGCRIGSIG